jgi:hypothetical protein
LLPLEPQILNISIVLFADVGLIDVFPGLLEFCHEISALWLISQALK